MADEVDRGHFGRRDQQIIGEVGGQGLAVFVEHHPFIERVADAVRGAADQLAVDDHRVEDAAAIVRQDVAEDPHSAGLYIDLDLRHRRSVGVGRLVDDQVLGGLHAGLDAAGQGVSRRAGDGVRHLAEADLHVRHALDPDLPPDDLEVVA